MNSRHRAVVAACVASQGHLRVDRRGVKTLTQMAKEIGTTKSTVRRWLRRDHWVLWMEYWASAEDIWEAEQQARAQLPHEVRVAKRQADRHRQAALMAHLDSCLAKLAIGNQVDGMA